jgi:ATPase family associated with various cellular activities (AAA)
MALSERLSEYVRAAFPGIWVQTHEQDDAIQEIAQLARQNDWGLATWDIDRGLKVNGQVADDSAVPSANDPLSAIKALSALATPDGTAILVLRNFHRYLGSAEIVQAVDTAISRGKQDRTFIVILSPVVQVPVELERQFVIVEHDLPGRDQLESIARSIATEPGDLPEGDDLSTVLDAAAGLTRVEAENAFSLSLVRHGRVVPETLWELKTGMLKKSGLLTLHKGGESFGDLGGLEALKAFTKRALESRRRGTGVRPRGVLLLGVPGTGKSAFAKALGHETGRPTLILDVGSLMGSLVGQTEERTRQALKIVDAMAPAILFIDEIEKALAGVQSSGQTDSGVSARMFGAFLGWLNDHESDVFVVATSNDISKLPPEFSRAERWDGTFFLDLPSRKEKDIIWRMYQDRYGIDPGQPWPLDDSWTGAEIKAACRLSALLDVPLVEAAQNVVPVATTAGESVERLRNWASGRCLAADRPGLYARNSAGSIPPGHPVNRDPSMN